MGKTPNLGLKAVQRQRLSQEQRLTMRQVRLMRLLEMPLEELERAVEAELRDDPGLQASNEEDIMDRTAMDSGGAGEDASSEQDYSTPDEEQKDLLRDALNGMKDDEDDPVDRRLRTERTVAGEDTLYEQLNSQIDLLDLNERERMLMDYVVGQLDGDGLLRSNVELMVEDLAIYQNVDVEPEELQTAIDKLKTLDPVGIGAQSLQECLLMQAMARSENAVNGLMVRILRDCFDVFSKGKVGRLPALLGADEESVNQALEEIRRLNPRPGARMGESVQMAERPVTPDFFVDVSEEGVVSFRINMGKLPRLAVAEDFENLIRKYEGVDIDKLRRKELESLRYARGKVYRAHAFLVTLQLRYRTLSLYMQAIVDAQREFFLSGNPEDLRPLLMKDVARRMGYDISNVSRCTSGKYVQTQWGIFPMKHFFVQPFDAKSDSGQFTRIMLHNAIRRIVDAEDKHRPLSDEAIARKLKQEGYDVARRTVTKYRERMGIKSTRERKRYD